VIAEDGIVGFARTRTEGWNDLMLEVSDSACPGTRRFESSGIYSTTSCRFALVTTSASAAMDNAAAPTVSGAAPQNLSGTRPEQMAQLLRNIVRGTRTRDWDTAIAAFPEARWQRQTVHAPNWVGSTNTRNGMIFVGGVAYDISLSGTATRINEITVNSPPDDLMDWPEIAAALPAQAAEGHNIGCHSPTGFGWVRLTVAAIPQSCTSR